MNPKAIFRMKSGAVIEAELFPEAAPQAVNSFIHLAQMGIYDGHVIERIDPGKCIDLSFRGFNDERARYMIPNDTAAGESLPVEFGSLMMGGYSRSAISGGECVFPLRTIERWTGEFPVFGKVLSGHEELRRLEQVELAFSGYEPFPGVKVMEPKEPEVIESVTVETYGVSYPEPERLTGWERPEGWVL